MKKPDKLGRILVVGLVMGLVAPSGVLAATFLSDESGDTRSDVLIEDDLFAAGNTVTVSESVADDIFAAGNQVSVEADGGADVIAAGNNVRIVGSFGDDVMAAGSVVRITARSAEDIMAAGNSVELTSDSKIEGNVYMAGTAVRVGGTIAGNVRLAGDKVSLAPETNIAGDLITYGENEPQIPAGVLIGGEIIHRGIGTDNFSPEAKFNLSGWVSRVLAWFVLAGLMLYVAPHKARKALDRIFKHGGKAFGIGLLWLIILIPAVVLLMISLVGIPVALVAGLMSMATVIMAHGVAVLAIGVWVMKFVLKRDSTYTWQHALLGAVVLKLIQLIPILGPLLAVVVTVMALGALGVTCWRTLRADQA